MWLSSSPTVATIERGDGERGHDDQAGCAARGDRPSPAGGVEHPVAPQVAELVHEYPDQGGVDEAEGLQAGAEPRCVHRDHTHSE
jgi:hypothetical protein